MQERDLMKYFESSDEFITFLSSSNRQLRNYSKEQRLIDRLTMGDLGLKRAEGTSEIKGEITHENIVIALKESGLVKNSNSLFGKYQIKRNLKEV